MSITRKLTQNIHSCTFLFSFSVQTLYKYTGPVDSPVANENPCRYNLVKLINHRFGIQTLNLFKLVGVPKRWWLPPTKATDR